MSVTRLAGDFNAAHAMAKVLMFIKAVGIERHKETGPAAAGVKFAFGSK
jgi:hypothetical protein